MSDNLLGLLCGVFTGFAVGIPMTSYALRRGWSFVRYVLVAGPLSFVLSFVLYYLVAALLLR